MTELSAVRLSIETDTADELRTAVQSGLYAYNVQFAGPMDNTVLTIGARDADKKIIGGLVADLQPGWKWMYVFYCEQDTPAGAPVGATIRTPSDGSFWNARCWTAGGCVGDNVKNTPTAPFAH